jgi:NAD+ diphosphatase
MHAEHQEHWFIFQGDKLLLIEENNGHKLPKYNPLTPPNLPFLRQYSLGTFNNFLCYCAEIDLHTPLPDHMTSVPLRKAFELLGVDWFNAAVKASTIINWDKNHQFCGRCSHLTNHTTGTFERICSNCGLAQYPRISPSIIVLIQRGDQILMARSPHFPPGAYGLIAGFVEAGESIEDTVHREVKEEVSIEVKNLRYFGSQSWPFPDSLMIGFIADYAAGEIVIDQKEIEAAGWYRYDNLPGRPSIGISIAGRLIDHFIAEQKSNTS